ncbi:MAG: DUF2796 domain-containing protein [Deltaproteobacteria bacterium]|jgi:hypothetical protein|nr:DUF2796 domain-containing protein [Deltaproteobacteria bacterium]
MNRKTIALLAAAPLLALFLPAALSAQGETHPAHEHGNAALSVTVEQASIDVDLSGPLASFISFEHEPSTPEQRSEMTALVGKLTADAGALFSFPAAWGCTLSKSSVDGENIPEDILGHAHKAEGEGHSHAGAEADHGHSDGEAHSDLDAEFEFACTAIRPEGAALDASGLFNAFPNLQDLDVRVVSPQGQRGAELSPSQSSFSW